MTTHRPAVVSSALSVLVAAAALSLVASAPAQRPLIAATLAGLIVVGVGTVLAWDLAEQAVNLGEQVGREPRTAGVELVHAGASAGNTRSEA